MANPYRIEVQVESLDSLYSALDPSPFRQRDLDPRAVEHIVQWASDAPPKAPLELQVRVSHGDDPEATEAETQQAVRNFFSYEAGILQRQHQRNRVRTICWLTVGLTIMTGAPAGTDASPSGMPTRTWGSRAAGGLAGPCRMAQSLRSSERTRASIAAPCGRRSARL